MIPEMLERMSKAACYGCASRRLVYSDYAGLSCMECGTRLTLAEAYIFGLRLTDAEKKDE